ncbi:flagellar brake domain-containing protein [Thalassotalea agariperforans]
MLAEHVSTSDEYFELLPGKILDIQINHPVTIRQKAMLVGYELGKYLILKYPKVVRSSDYKDVLVEGNVIIVRYLLEGSAGKCYAFRSTIKHIVQFPEKLIFIAYPETLENRELRRQRRQVTHIPASISLLAKDGNTTESKIKGIISDINAKGCGFSFKVDNDKVRVNTCEVIVSIHNPVTGEERIPAKVCNSRNQNGRVSVGIQFIDAESQVLTLLEHLQIEPNL